MVPVVDMMLWEANWFDFRVLAQGWVKKQFNVIIMQKLMKICYLSAMLGYICQK